MAALRSHLAQRPGRRAPGQRGKLAEALGRDGAEVQVFLSQALQVGQLGHLQLHPLGRRRSGPVVQPHQAGHAQLGVGGHQGIELVAALGGQLRVQAPADLLLGGDPGRRHRPHEPVQTGTHDSVGAELGEGLAEQNRGRVVLQGPGRQRIAESLPLAWPAHPPAGLLHDGNHVAAAGATIDFPGVAGEGRRSDADLFGHEGHDLSGGGGQIGGHEA